MTPAARIAAAAEILDLGLSGTSAEKALTTWARRSRFAGSGDRAAIRDLVFDAVRCKRSYAAFGGTETGRGLMIGALRARGVDPAEMMTGERHALSPVQPSEQPQPFPWPDGVRLDMPDWLLDPLQTALGSDMEPICQVLKDRAPAFLRVNTAEVSRSEAQALLAKEDIGTALHEYIQTALHVTRNARRVQSSKTFQSGLVELQDAHSQAVVAALPKAERVLDFCAGGGGKSLALASTGAEVCAHDALPARMKDLPLRAKRANASIEVLASKALLEGRQFDLVLADVPCSGSGAWRRQPEAKWNLTKEALKNLRYTQSEIFETCRTFVAPGGFLAYVTCSVLDAENGGQLVAARARGCDWPEIQRKVWLPGANGDGFFLSVLRRPAEP